MKNFQITKQKGFLKSFHGLFMASEISKRIKYVVTVVQPKLEQVIVFKPVTGIDEISDEDLKSLKDLIADAEI